MTAAISGLIDGAPSLESQAACTRHLEPASMRRMDRCHDNTIAMGTPENCPHARRIETQRAYGCSRAAGRALNLCGRDLKNEDFLKKTCGGVAIQNNVRSILRHGAYPPEGPKRSVLMVRGLCPSSTRSLETSSTKGVGPQTKIFGFRSGGGHASASSVVWILPR